MTAADAARRHAAERKAAGIRPAFMDKTGPGLGPAKPKGRRK